MVGFAVEITVSFDRAIILASRLVQDYSNPVARCKGCSAPEMDNCVSAIIQLHCLANSEVRRAHGRYEVVVRDSNRRNRICIIRGIKPFQRSPLQLP